MFVWRRYILVAARFPFLEMPNVVLDTYAARDQTATMQRDAVTVYYTVTIVQVCTSSIVQNIFHLWK